VIGNPDTARQSLALIKNSVARMHYPDRAMQRQEKEKIDVGVCSGTWLKSSKH
jgi:hypothetical protein